MTERVLTRRELNRALLARQLLLERKRMPVARAVERLAGLQAQYAPSPYLSLWTRIEALKRDDLTRALERRRLVKALLMRGTLHIVTPTDYWAFSTARRQLGGVPWPPAFARRLPETRLRELADDALVELRGGPRTLQEMLTWLSPAAPEGISATFIWRRLQGHGSVVHVPPSGTWGYHKEGVYARAGDWVPADVPDADEAFDRLVSSYLAAFGPATKHDISQWAGIPRLAPISAALERIELRTFRDEGGKLLYDLPRAPLPHPDTPAPPRLVPRYDNLVLAHDERSRILGDVPVSRIVTKNAIVHAVFLLDGFVAGTWTLERGRVVLAPLGRLSREERRALEDEAERLEAWAA